MARGLVGPLVFDTTLTSYTAPDFSAVTDARFGEHLVYPGWSGSYPNGTVLYAYHAPSLDGAWTFWAYVFPAGVYSSPTITADYTTNNLYAFAIPGSSVVMREKPSGQTWFDSSAVYPVTNMTSLSNLGSNFGSASGTNSSYASLIWTAGGPTYNLYFASIPLQTTWSPYSSPRDPWDGNGLAPHGQYFSNLGEYVSPSSGMLTVRQTDMSLQGRGLNLEITRVYTEPKASVGSKKPG